MERTCCAQKWIPTKAEPNAHEPNSHWVYTAVNVVGTAVNNQ